MKHSLYLFAAFALLFGNVGAKRLQTAPISFVPAEKASVNAAKYKVSTLPQDELYVIDENGEEHQMTPEELATEIEEEKAWYQTDTAKYAMITAGVTAAALTGVYLYDPTLLPAAGAALWNYKDDAIKVTKKATKGMGKWLKKGWNVSKKMAIAGAAALKPYVAEALEGDAVNEELEEQASKNTKGRKKTARKNSKRKNPSGIKRMLRNWALTEDAKDEMLPQDVDESKSTPEEDDEQDAQLNDYYSEDETEPLDDAMNNKEQISSHMVNEEQVDDVDE